MTTTTSTSSSTSTGASTTAMPTAADVERNIDAHVDRLAVAIPALHAAGPTLARWGTVLAARLLAGARLLAAGNGGSAAEAQHLTAEFAALHMLCRAVDHVVGR